MNREQTENLARLEKLTAELWTLADLFNLAGYKASPQELAELDKIANLATTCQELARK